MQQRHINGAIVFLAAWFLMDFTEFAIELRDRSQPEKPTTLYCPAPNITVTPQFQLPDGSQTWFL